MKNTRVLGHGLLHEGAALVPSEAPSYYRMTHQKVGVGYCACGTPSPELPSTAARQRWHRELHKPAALARQSAS